MQKPQKKSPPAVAQQEVQKQYIRIDLQNRAEVAKFLVFCLLREKKRVSLTLETRWFSREIPLILG